MILTLDNEYSVVLDACVLAPMPLCDTLMRCGEEPALFRIFWSERILGEVAKTLTEQFGYTSAQADRRLRAMRTAFPEAVVEFPDDLLLALPSIPDPDDKHVVGAAIAARAHRHFKS